VQYVYSTDRAALSETSVGKRMWWAVVGCSSLLGELCVAHGGSVCGAAGGAAASEAAGAAGEAVLLGALECAGAWGGAAGGFATGVAIGE
jgi:hypothetical protein